MRHRRRRKAIPLARKTGPLGGLQDEPSPIAQLRTCTHDPYESRSYTNLRKFLDTSESFISARGALAGGTYRAGKFGAQATAQSELTRPLLVANRFHAISQASMMS